MKEDCYLIGNLKFINFTIVVIAVRGTELRYELRIRIRKGQGWFLGTVAVGLELHTINDETIVILATG
jgi:hypothetical protein